MSTYATTKRFAAQNPNTVSLFRKLIRRAQRIAADKHLVRQVLPEYCAIDAGTAGLASMGTFPTSLSQARPLLPPSSTP